MAANTRVTGVDVTTPDKLVCNLDISAGGDLPISERVTVSKLFISYGRDPSTATIEIPLGGFNPAVLLEVLHGKRVAVDMIKNGSAVRMLNGNVVRDRSIVNPANNTLAVQVADERVFLNSWKIFGRVALKENGVDNVYQLAQPSLFNFGGLRNGARTTAGDLLFATYPEWATNDTTIKAINFSLAGIFEYVERWFVNGTYPDFIRTKFAFFSKFPETVIWPKGFGAGLDTSAWNGAAILQGNSSQGDERNGREFSIDGVGFLDWVEAALDGTGFRLSLEPNGDKNEMVLVPLRPSGLGTTIITNDPTIGPSAVSFERNSEDTLTQTSVVALPVELETRVSEESEA